MLQYLVLEYADAIIAITASIMAGFICTRILSPGMIGRTAFISTLVSLGAIVVGVPILKWHMTHVPQGLPIIRDPEAYRAHYFDSITLGFPRKSALYISLVAYWLNVVIPRAKNVIRNTRHGLEAQRNRLNGKLKIIMHSRRVTDVFHFHYLCGFALFICTVRLVPLLSPDFDFNTPVFRHLCKLWLGDLALFLIAFVLSSQIEITKKKTFDARSWYVAGFGWLLFDVLGIAVVFANSHF